MKEKLRKNATFYNFNITQKKSNISSKIDDMNKKEYNDVSLITTSFLPMNLINGMNNDLFIKNNLINFEKATPNTNIKDVNTPLTKKNSNFLFPLKENSVENRKNIKFKRNKMYNKIKNKILFSTFKKNNLIQKNQNGLYNKLKIGGKKEIDQYYSTNSSLNKKLNERKDESKFSSENKNTINYNNIKNETLPNFHTINKDLNNFRDFRINSNKKYKLRNFMNVNDKSIKKKYYITSENFTPKPKKDINQINDYLYKTNTNKFVPNKSFKVKYKNYKIMKSHQSFNNMFNNSQGENNKRSRTFYNTKKIPRINISYWKLREIENNLSTEYYNNYMDMHEKNKMIKKIKERCKSVLKELDKKNNFEIQQIMSEIRDQLLGLGFKEFYRYLLTILKNYDKKVTDYAFDIVEDKNECPEELKFKNVKYRHQKFKQLLDLQFISGINVKKHLDNLIHKSKSKIRVYNNKYNFDFSHNNLHSNNFIDKIFNNKNNNQNSWNCFT